MDIENNYSNNIMMFNNVLRIKNSNIILNKKAIKLLEFKEVNDLFYKIVGIIYEKIVSGSYVSRAEAEFFVCLLCLETIKLLDLDIPDIPRIEFMYPDNEFLHEKAAGVTITYKDSDVVFVFYNQSIIDDLCNKEISVSQRLIYLLAITHELVHVKQLYDRFNGVFSLSNYILTLEYALRYGNYYNENYYYTREEMDANVKGIELLSDIFLNFQILDKNGIGIFSSFLEMLFYDIVESRVKKDTLLEHQLLYKSSEYVKKNPELIQRVPLLSLSYKENGDLYSIKELFEKRLSMVESIESMDELNLIYEFIIDSYLSMMGSDCIREEIGQYLDNVGYADKFAKSMFDRCEMTDKIEKMPKEDLNKRIQKRILILKKEL